MRIPDLVYAFYGLLTVGVFLAWFYVVWQAHVVERGRQRLCEVRDQWFDLVTADARFRDHPACRAMRALFDAQIACLHKILLPIVVLRLLSGSAEGGTASKLVHSLIERLPDDVLRQQARRSQDAAILQIGLVMFQRSLLFWIGAIALSPVALFVVPVLLHRRRNRNTSKRSAAWDIGPKAHTLQPFTEVELSIAVQQDAELPRRLSAAWRCTG